MRKLINPNDDNTPTPPANLQQTKPHAPPGPTLHGIHQPTQNYPAGQTLRSFAALITGLSLAIASRPAAL